MFNWINFLTYAIITAVTPGPNNIMAMSCASRMGFKKALPFTLGVWAGFTAVMMICALFCSMLSVFVEKIRLPLLIIGAVYMLYLAWKTFRSTSEIEESSSGSGFVSGFVLQFVNFKIQIYGIVSMQAYILPYFSESPAALIGFAALLAFIGFVFTVCWAAFGSVFKLLSSKYAKLTNTIMALLLVYCAVSLFL